MLLEQNKSLLFLGVGGCHPGHGGRKARAHPTLAYLRALGGEKAVALGLHAPRTESFDGVNKGVLASLKLQSGQSLQKRFVTAIFILLGYICTKQDMAR